MAAGIGMGSFAGMSDMPMSQGGTGASPAKPSYDEASLSPLTIHQFQTANVSEVDGRVTVDGVELKDVALCGRIVEAEPTDSGLALTVEDGTGRIRTKQWYATNDDGSTNAAMKEALDAQATPGAFVRLVGSCKLVSNRAMVSHVMCQLLVDPNELTLHFMECIHVHRDRTMRISFAEGGSSPEGMAVTSDPASGTAMAGAGTGFGMAGMGGMPGMAGMSGMPAMGGAGGGMSSSLAVSGPGGVSGEPLVEQVNSRICTYSGDNGAPVSELVQFFAAKGVSEAEVRQVVEELSMAGRVYSTVDDEHVKSTEEGE